MNTQQKLLAAGVLLGAAFVYPKTLDAIDDCEDYCIEEACEYCGTCADPGDGCFPNRYLACVEAHCT